jgi:hypothetical protein
VWYLSKEIFWVAWGIVIAVTLLKMHRDQEFYLDLIQRRLAK